MTILVTGASGFIGSALCQELIRQGKSVRCVSRSTTSAATSSGTLTTADFSSETDWAAPLEGIKEVVHLAAEVHVMNRKTSAQSTTFGKVNFEGTTRLAHQAAKAGVRRFVFLSTIKVNGESTGKSKPFTTDDVPSPGDAYSISKYKAERALWQISLESDMEVVIIRPPLVYGPGVKGNFANLIKWVRRGLPLPLGSVHNRRSLIALENLVHFIVLCSDPERSPRAANELFLISDDEDISTTDLLRKVARASCITPRLLPMPAHWIRATARLLGKREEAERLLGSLVIDCSKARDLLGWQPVITMDEQLKKMALHDSAV